MEVHKYAAARKRTRAPARNSTITVTRINPDIWALALILADGNTHRRKILSATQVIVTNNPGRQK